MLLGSGVTKHVVINPCQTAQHFESWQLDDFCTVQALQERRANDQIENYRDDRDDDTGSQTSSSKKSESDDGSELSDNQKSGEHNNCNRYKRQRI